MMGKPNWYSIPCWNIMLHQDCFPGHILQCIFVFLFQLLQVHVIRGWHVVCEFLSTTFWAFFFKVLYQENCWGWRGPLFMQFTWKVLYRSPDVPKSTWYVTSVIFLVIIRGPCHWFSSLPFLMGLKTRT